MNKYFWMVIIVVAGVGILYFLPSPSRENGEQISNGIMQTASQFVKDGVTWSRYHHEDLGVEFVYRVAPEGYMFSESGGGDWEHASKLFTFMLGSDAQELSESTEPREGPPVIRVVVFENAERLDAQDWADANPRVSGIDLPLLVEPSATRIGGVRALRYETDGLYRRDTLVVARGEMIYLILGEYMDSDSTIRRDFEMFVDSLKFL